MRVSLPSTLRRLGENTFSGTKLRRVQLPELLEAIGARCFQGTALEQLDIPERVTEIGNGAFSGCTGLKKVTFAPKAQVQVLSENAFRGTGLESFDAPASLREIRAGAFAECPALRTVTLSEGLVSLGPQPVAQRRYDQRTPGNYWGSEVVGVFEGSGLEEISLPTTLTQVHESTFRNCAKLAAVFVAKGCPASIRNRVPQSTNILPPRETKLGNDLLWSLRATKEVQIPDGV